MVDVPTMVDPRPSNGMHTYILKYVRTAGNREKNEKQNSFFCFFSRSFSLVSSYITPVHGLLHIGPPHGLPAVLLERGQGDPGLAARRLRDAAAGRVRAEGVGRQRPPRRPGLLGLVPQPRARAAGRGAGVPQALPLRGAGAQG